MRLRYKLVIAAFLLAILGSLIWSASHYHDKYQSEQSRADAAEQSLALATATITDMQTRQRDVAALDAKYTKEMADAKNTISNLRRDVESGAKRLRVAATCPGGRKTTATPGVDDAGAPELTPDARRNYYDHRDGIATVDKMIRGMQDYVRTQCLK